MSTLTTGLKLVKQDFDENPDTWGDVLNSSLELVDQAVTGRVQFSSTSTSSPATIPTDTAKNVCIEVINNPGTDNYTIALPDTRRFYLIRNLMVNSGGSTYDLTLKVKTVASSGTVDVANNDTALVYVLESGTTRAVKVGDTTVANATNAAQLGGEPASDYARLDVLSGLPQAFNYGQRVVPVNLGSFGGVNPSTITTNNRLANIFNVTLTGNATLENPVVTPDGQFVTWKFTAAVAGAQLTFGNRFRFENGASSVSLTGTNGAIDIITALYDGTANRWFSTIARGFIA